MNETYTVLKETEKELYDYILLKTSFIDKQNAFIGHLPDITNAFSLEFEPEFTNRFYPCLGSRKFGCILNARFDFRQDCLNFSTQIAEAFREFDNTNTDYVVEIKIKKIYDIQGYYRLLYNQKEKKLHFETQITFDVIALNTEVSSRGIIGVGEIEKMEIQ